MSSGAACNGFVQEYDSIPSIDQSWIVIPPALVLSLIQKYWMFMCFNFFAVQIHPPAS